MLTAVLAVAVAVASALFYLTITSAYEQSRVSAESAWTLNQSRACPTVIDHANSLQKFV